LGQPARTFVGWYDHGKNPKIHLSSFLNVTNITCQRLNQGF